MAEDSTKSSGSGLKVVLILLVVVLGLCICCAIAAFGFMTLTFGAALGAVNSVVSESVCEISVNDITDTYQEATTANFRAEVSQSEFEDLMGQLETDFCANLKGLNVMSMLSQGWNVAFNVEGGQSVLTISGQVNGKQLDLKMVGDDQDDLKIDELTIE